MTRDYLDEVEAQLMARVERGGGGRPPQRRRGLLAIVRAVLAAAAIVAVVVAVTRNTPPGTARRRRRPRPRAVRPRPRPRARTPRPPRPRPPRPARRRRPGRSPGLRPGLVHRDRRGHLVAARNRAVLEPAVHLGRPHRRRRPQFVGTPAPRTDQVSQLRFADAQNGFAYGPQLWVTHDAGASWNQLDPGGQVVELEAGGGYAYAIVRSQNGPAASCGRRSGANLDPASDEWRSELRAERAGLGRGARELQRVRPAAARVERRRRTLHVARGSAERAVQLRGDAAGDLGAVPDGNAERRLALD